jgi:hypothetical protein
MVDEQRVHWLVRPHYGSSNPRDTAIAAFGCDFQDPMGFLEGVPVAKLVKNSIHLSSISVNRYPMQLASRRRKQNDFESDLLNTQYDQQRERERE